MLEPFVIVSPYTVRDWLRGTPRPTQRDGWRTQSICGQKGHWLKAFVYDYMIVYVSFSFVQSLSRYGFLVCFDFWLCQGHGMALPNMTYTESPKPATRRLVTCFENASLDTLLVVVLSYSHRACKIWTDPSQGLWSESGAFGKSLEVPHALFAIRVTSMCWICYSSLVTARTNSRVTSTRNEAEQSSAMSGYVPPIIPYFCLLLDKCKGHDGSGRSGASGKLVYKLVSPDREAWWVKVWWQRPNSIWTLSALEMWIVLHLAISLVSNWSLLVSPFHHRILFQPRHVNFQGKTVRCLGLHPPRSKTI